MYRNADQLAGRLQPHRLAAQLFAHTFAFASSYRKQRVWLACHEFAIHS
jgi:hypothetical protein